MREGYADGLAYAAIAELLSGRTPAAVGAYARELGLATGARRWTVEDDRRLAQLLAEATNVLAVAAALERTPEAVRLRARKLGLGLPSRTRTPNRGPWTAAEDAFLSASPGLDAGTLATRLGRSDVAVRRRLTALGLRNGRRGSPHFALEAANGLSPGQLRLIERAYRRGNGRVLISLARRLGVTPGEVKRVAEQHLAER